MSGLLFGTIGYLSVGAVVGSGLGWLLVDEFLVRTGTSRFWSVPGRSETWMLLGTFGGGLAGMLGGILFEAAYRRKTVKNDRPENGPDVPAAKKRGKKRGHH
jgi:hypothetical protein